MPALTQFVNGVKKRIKKPGERESSQSRRANTSTPDHYKIQGTTSPNDTAKARNSAPFYHAYYFTNLFNV